MKFKINNSNWKIIEVDQKRLCEEKGEKEDADRHYFGLTIFSKQEVLLWNKLPKHQKMKTLIHELEHCYIGNYITFSDMNLTDEILCDISANSHYIIHEIVEKYFGSNK